MFNADPNAMCGNALCSVAKLFYERGIEKKTIKLGNSHYPSKIILRQSKKSSVISHGRNRNSQFRNEMFY